MYCNKELGFYILNYENKSWGDDAGRKSSDIGYTAESVTPHALSRVVQESDGR
jgi:hypothetical protein